MRAIRHAISQAKLIVRSVVKWRKFRGNKKIALTLICYARFTQDSRNALNRSTTGKNCFFKFILPNFWTDLNGCRQRILFARQLTQRKCSLCSQGSNSTVFMQKKCLQHNSYAKSKHTHSEYFVQNNTKTPPVI